MCWIKVPKENGLRHRTLRKLIQVYLYLPVTDLPWDQLRLFLGTEIGYWNYLLNTEKKVGRPNKKMDGLIIVRETNGSNE